MILKTILQRTKKKSDEPVVMPSMDVPVETLANLTIAERNALSRLTREEGFPVLVKLMNAICYEATATLVKTNIGEKALVNARHTDAHLKHEFTSRLIGMITHLNVVPRANPKENEENGRTNQHIYFNRAGTGSASN